MIKVVPNDYEAEEMKQGYDGANMALDSMMKRFKRQVMASNLLLECENHEFFIQKSLKRKMKQEQHTRMMRKLNKGRKH